MDSSDEEAFNEFIEFDCNAAVTYSAIFEESDSNKENSTKSKCVVAKSKPTNPAQIEKIIAFVKENNEQLIEKSAYDLLWMSLIEDLNRLGPPEYTADKWKRVWSQYKYRNKMRLTELFGSTLQNEPTHTDPKRPKRATDELSIQTENSLSSQMAKILEQQDIILSHIVNQGENIKRSSELLEELSKKIK